MATWEESLHPRTSEGQAGGGQFASSNAENSPAQDAAAKALFERMKGMSPAERQKFLSSMSPEQLVWMGRYSKTHSSDVDPAATAAVAVEGTRRVSNNPPAKEKPEKKKPAAKKPAAAKPKPSSRGGSSRSGSKKEPAKAPTKKPAPQRSSGGPGAAQKPASPRQAPAKPPQKPDPGPAKAPMTEAERAEAQREARRRRGAATKSYAAQLIRKAAARATTPPEPRRRYVTDVIAKAARRERER